MFKIESNCFAVKIDNLRVLDFSKTFNELHDIIIYRRGKFNIENIEKKTWKRCF